RKTLATTSNSRRCHLRRCFSTHWERHRRHLKVWASCSRRQAAATCQTRHWNRLEDFCRHTSDEPKDFYNTEFSSKFRGEFKWMNSHLYFWTRELMVSKHKVNPKHQQTKKKQVEKDLFCLCHGCLGVSINEFTPQNVVESKHAKSVGFESPGNFKEEKGKTDHEEEELQALFQGRTLSPFVLCKEDQDAQEN